MAIGTDYVALCHLVEDAVPAAIADSLADVEELVSTMVELKDERIRFAAI
jgi:DICT domain-containing protein